MDENNTNNNNIVSENSTTDLETDLSINDDTTTSDTLADDNIAMALDYYDRYYEQVLDNLEVVTLNQDTIIDNQETLIAQNDEFKILSYTLIFIICIIFIYNFLRNMIIVK